MGTPFTLKIYYPDGDPENMWLATKPTWTGKVFFVSRSFWSECINRYKKDLETTGIYVLVGSGEDGDDDLQSIYIGQTDNLRERIDCHQQDEGKDFYQGIICVAEDGDLTNTNFRWMESDLIERAIDINRCDLKNKVTPNKPKMTEADSVITKQFIQAILPILQIAEIQAFTTPKSIGQELKDDEVTKLGTEQVRELRRKTLVAFQKRENLNLLKLSSSKYYNQDKTIWVCCIISKPHGEEKPWDYEFFTDQNRVDFLEKGEKGYFILGMSGQSKAIAITVDELQSKSEDGKIRRWSNVQKKSDGLELTLIGGGKLDLTPYLFDIT